MSSAAPQSASAQQVGRVVALWRYPVKSMAAESLREADVSWHGVAGDRRWAFIRDGQQRNGFPWLTIRQRNDLVRYRPRLLDPSRPDTSATVVRTPSGDEYDVTDPALAAALGAAGDVAGGAAGGAVPARQVRVIKQDRGVFDSMPLSLITTQTVASLRGQLTAGLDARRFRPNLLIEATAQSGYPEDAWLGAVLRIGGVRMRVDRRDPRCVVVNVDPETAVRDPGVLRAIAAERDTCLGVYGSTVRPGRIAIGDPVLIDA